MSKLQDFLKATSELQEKVQRGDVDPNKIEQEIVEHCFVDMFKEIFEQTVIESLNTPVSCHVCNLSAPIRITYVNPDPRFAEYVGTHCRCYLCTVKYFLKIAKDYIGHHEHHWGKLSELEKTKIVSEFGLKQPSREKIRTVIAKLRDEFSDYWDDMHDSHEIDENKVIADLESILDEIE